MNNISISTKIKILGTLLLISVFSVISVTIYLNQNNIKDATIVNIAGKQRMLTQMITKNIYYLYQEKSDNFTQIDHAIESFKYGLDTLKNGNKLLNISPAPSDKINTQIATVEVLWKQFEKNTQIFKLALLNNDIQQINSLLKYFAQNNDKLLQEVDQIVSLYTWHIEDKASFIKNFQYLAFAFLFIFSLYAIIQLKQIEEHAKEFMAKYKELAMCELDQFKPIETNSNEKEFTEITNNMNCFINRVNSVVNYSQSALEQSEMASKRLEDLTEEFGDIIGELENKSDILKQLDMSEDIAIESSENLLKTTKKLNALKVQLDQLLASCGQGTK